MLPSAIADRHTAAASRPIRRAAPRWPAWAVPLLALLALSACSASVPKVQRLSAYPGWEQRPLEARIQAPDAAMLDRTHRTNLQYGWDVRPHAAAPHHPLAPLVRRVLAGLPQPVKRLAEQHLVAVFLVEGDVGTAVTEGVRGFDGRWRHAYMGLNLSALQRTANAWATWKESSAFHAADGFALHVVLEPPASDTVEGAIRFIVLHELGHVLGLGLGAHGYWDAPGLPLATRDAPFVRLSWQPDGHGDLVSRWKTRFPVLRQAAFYRFDKAPHSLAQAEPVYRALARTDFPSLYGTINPYDDFAETFAIYVHTRLLGRPYRVVLLHDGQPRYVYRSCVDTGTCPRKVAALEALLGLRATGSTARVP